MDVKRYMFMGVDFIKERESPDGNIVFYEDIKHYIPSPDPAEVERAIDKIIILSSDLMWFNVKMMEKEHYQTGAELNKARSELLKLVGG